MCRVMKINNSQDWPMMTRPSDVIVRFKNNPKLMFKYFNEKVGVQCVLPFNLLHAGEGED